MDLKVKAEVKVGKKSFIELLSPEECVHKHSNTYCKHRIYCGPIDQTDTHTLPTAWFKTAFNLLATSQTPLLNTKSTNTAQCLSISTGVSFLAPSWFHHSHSALWIFQQRLGSPARAPFRAVKNTYPPPLWSHQPIHPPAPLFCSVCCTLLWHISSAMYTHTHRGDAAKSARNRRCTVTHLMGKSILR